MGATTLATAAIITALAGAGATAYSSIEQSKAQKKASKETKKAADKQANIANSEPTEQQVIKRQSLGRLVRGGSVMSSIGSGGVGQSSSSGNKTLGS